MSGSSVQQNVEGEAIKDVRPAIKPKPIVPPKPRQASFSTNSELKSPLLPPNSPTFDIPSAIKISQLTGPQPYGARRTSLKRWSSSVGEEVPQESNTLPSPAENVVPELSAKVTNQLFTASVKPLQTGSVWKGKSPFMLTTRGWGEQKSQVKDMNESESFSQKQSSSSPPKDVNLKKNETALKENTAPIQNNAINKVQYSSSSPLKSTVTAGHVGVKSDVQDPKLSLTTAPEDVTNTSIGFTEKVKQTEMPVQDKIIQNSQEPSPDLSVPPQPDLYLEASKQPERHKHFTQDAKTEDLKSGQQETTECPKDLNGSSTQPKNKSLRTKEHEDPQLVPLVSTAMPKANNTENVTSGKRTEVMEEQDTESDYLQTPQSTATRQNTEQRILGNLEQDKPAVSSRTLTSDMTPTGNEINTTSEDKEGHNSAEHNLLYTPPKPYDLHEGKAHVGSCDFNTSYSDQGDRKIVDITDVQSPICTVKATGICSETSREEEQDKSKFGLHEYDVTVQPKQYVPHEESTKKQPEYPSLYRSILGSCAKFPHDSEPLSAPEPPHTADLHVGSKILENDKPIQREVYSPTADESKKPSHSYVERDTQQGKPQEELIQLESSGSTRPEPTFMLSELNSQDTTVTLTEKLSDYKKPPKSEEYTYQSPLQYTHSQSQDQEYHYDHILGEDANQPDKPSHTNKQSADPEYKNLEKLDKPNDMCEQLQWSAQGSDLTKEPVYMYEQPQEPVSKHLHDAEDTDLTHELKEESYSSHQRSEDSFDKPEPMKLEEMIHKNDKNNSEEPINIYNQSHTYEHLEQLDQHYQQPSATDYKYHQLEEPVHEYEQSEQVAHSYEHSEQLIQEYETSKQPAHGYELSEEALHGYKQSEIPVHMYKHSDETVHGYEQSEEPVHRYKGTEETVHGYKQSKEPAHRYEHSEETVHGFEQSDEPSHRYGHSEETVHGYERTEETVHGYKQSEEPVNRYEFSEETVYGYKQPEKSVHRHEHSEEMVHGYEQSEKPVHRYEHSDETVHGYEHSEEPVHRFEHSDETVHGYKQSEKPVHRYEHSEETVHGYEQSEEPVHRFEHSDETVHGYEQSEKPVHRYEHSEETVYGYEQSEKPVHYEHSEETVDTYTQSDEPVHGFEHSEEMVHVYEQSKTPNKRYKNSEEPVHEYEQSEEAIHKYGHSEDPVKYKLSEGLDSESHNIGQSHKPSDEYTQSDETHVTYKHTDQHVQVNKKSEESISKYEMLEGTGNRNQQAEGIIHSIDKSQFPEHKYKQHDEPVYSCDGVNQYGQIENSGYIVTGSDAVSSEYTQPGATDLQCLQQQYKPVQSDEIDSTPDISAVSHDILSKGSEKDTTPDEDIAPQKRDSYSEKQKNRDMSTDKVPECKIAEDHKEANQHYDTQSKEAQRVDDLSLESRPAITAVQSEVAQNKEDIKANQFLNGHMEHGKWDIADNTTDSMIENDAEEPGKAQTEEPSANFDFLEGTVVLDSSFMRGRASLGKKRGHRTPAGAAGSEEENDPEYWMFRDSTEPKSLAERHSEEEQNKDTCADETPVNSPSPVKSPNKKGIFAGIISPSLLKGRLKTRSKTTEDETVKPEAEESKSPVKEKPESSSSLNWLQALKKKKKSIKESSKEEKKKQSK